MPPNEVLKLLHLSGKAGLAEDLWHQMGLVGVQGLIGWLVMVDVWQGRWERLVLLKFLPQVRVRSSLEMQSI